MKNLHSYFLEHSLFDEQNLINHCERNLVRIHQSPKFPHLRSLHYQEEAVYSKTWSEFCKACRGVVVDLRNKKLLAVPLFKFWNMTESPGPSYAECQSFGPFTVSEKLDGSMIILFRDLESGLVHATTKGSFDSTQGEDATKWAREHLPEALLEPKFLERHTLMFEWIDYGNKIVIDYSRKGYQPGLYLIGVRENFSEKLFSYEEVQEFAKIHGTLTVKTYPFASLDAVIDKAKDLPFQEEGYVVRFRSNGIMCKVKGDEYLRIHRFISSLNDKNLLELMVEGKEKETLETCPEEYRDEVISSLENYRKQALELQSQVYRLFALAPKESRREFALHVKLRVPNHLQRYLFHLMDQKPLELRMFYQSFLKERLPSVGPIQIPENSLVVLAGPSGSGKSYLAHKLFNSRNIVSSDRCRELILWAGNVPEITRDEYWPKMQGVSYRAFQMMYGDIGDLLSAGELAVADATHLSPRSRKDIEKIAQQRGIPVTYIVSVVPENLCVERDASRRFPVGAEVVHKQVSQMEEVMKDLSGKPNVIFITPKTSDRLSVQLVKSNGEIMESKTPAALEENAKKDTILCDLDGTLANIEQRLHYLHQDKPNWDSFYQACDTDTPNEWCVSLLTAMKAAGFRVILVSARTTNVLEKTKTWLDKIGLSDTVELVLVRQGDDHTQDQVLKQKWLDQSGLKNRILFVVDDRQRVVDQWRANGLTCLQCNVWEERKKTPIRL